VSATKGAIVTATIAPKAEAVASVAPDAPLDGPPRDVVRGNVCQLPVVVGGDRDGGPVVTFYIDALQASRDIFDAAAANGPADYQDLIRQSVNATASHALWPSIPPGDQRRLLGLMRDVLRMRCAV
jgi:hypothetical protein